jgi:hypothetical protein
MVPIQPLNDIYQLYTDVVLYRKRKLFSPLQQSKENKTKTQFQSELNAPLSAYCSLIEYTLF